MICRLAGLFLFLPLLQGIDRWREEVMSCMASLMKPIGSQIRGQQAAQDNEKGDVVHLLCKVACIDPRRGINRPKKSLVEAVRPVDC